jgi:hypothetical protein
MPAVSKVASSEQGAQEARRQTLEQRSIEEQKKQRDQVQQLERKGDIQEVKDEGQQPPTRQELANQRRERHEEPEPEPENASNAGLRSGSIINLKI